MCDRGRECLQHPPGPAASFRTRQHAYIPRHARTHTWHAPQMVPKYRLLVTSSRYHPSRKRTQPMMACASHTSCSPPCCWLPAQPGDGRGWWAGRGGGCVGVGGLAARGGGYPQPHTTTAGPQGRLTGVHRCQQALDLGLGVWSGVLHSLQGRGGPVQLEHSKLLLPSRLLPHDVQPRGGLVQCEVHGAQQRVATGLDVCSIIPAGQWRQGEEAR